MALGLMLLTPKYVTTCLCFLTISQSGKAFLLLQDYALVRELHLAWGRCLMGLF